MSLRYPECLIPYVMHAALFAPLFSIGAAATSEPGTVSQGRGETVTPNLLDCKQAGARLAPLGTIVASDATKWSVPADVRFNDGTKAFDLYNECTGITHESLTTIDLNQVPVVQVDPDGELITGYLLADNYFELYVNGQLVAVDPVPFTPFNSSIVRFRAKRPITYAIKMVDWEEKVGLGTEQFGQSADHPGDGGFVARFSDGTITDSSSKAQSFYIAPLSSPHDVVLEGSVRATPKLARIYPQADHNARCAERCYAMHYRVPADWMTSAFDDSQWPAAIEFQDRDLGIHRLPAYTRFAEAFGPARPIWSFNLVLDNLVLARKVVP